MVRKPNCDLAGQVPDRAQLPSLYREYRKLLVRSYVLRLRLTGLNALLMLTYVFARPELLRLIRRRFDCLKADLAEFRNLSRAFRMRLRAIPVQPRPAAPPRQFQNPWL